MLTPLVLEGRSVRLEPLGLEHADDLARAGAEDRGSYGYTWVPDGPEDADRYVRAALEHQAGGRALPWAVRWLRDDRVVGSTRFLDLGVFVWPPGVAQGPEPSDERPPHVLEIGSTWYAATAQRTGVNAEVKLLQLTHAFEA